MQLPKQLVEELDNYLPKLFDKNNWINDYHRDIFNIKWRLWGDVPIPYFETRPCIHYIYKAKPQESISLDYNVLFPIHPSHPKMRLN
jgi:hypothetical protein